MKRRILAMLLAIAMLVGNVPVQAFATEAEPQETTACITEGCTYGAGHSGECSTFVACTTEGCTFASGHEGSCSNYVAPEAPKAEPAADAAVYVTVSNRGELGMAYEEVTVSDINADGKLSVDEALYAAHTVYGKGYTSQEGAVTKLWDVETTNVSFFVNHSVISTDVGAETIGAGDYLVASVDQDAVNDYDKYSRFNAMEKSVKAGESFTLTLTDDAGNALAGMEIGLSNGNGSTTMTGLTTDVNGSVTLTLDQEGLYCVTAKGTVVESSIDVNTREITSFEAPIVAPVCIVTVAGTVSQSVATWSTSAAAASAQAASAETEETSDFYQIDTGVATVNQNYLDTTAIRIGADVVSHSRTEGTNEFTVVLSKDTDTGAAISLEMDLLAYKQNQYFLSPSVTVNGTACGTITGADSGVEGTDGTNGAWPGSWTDGSVTPTWENGKADVVIALKRGRNPETTYTLHLEIESSNVAVTEVTLDRTEATLEVGGTVTLTATVSPEDATDKTVTWTSDNTAVATVADGVVTAVAAGTATITATAGGKSATCTVTVEEAEPEYVLDVSSYDAPLMPYAAVSTITFSGAEVVGTPVVTVEKVSDYVKTAVIDVVLAEGTANNAEIGLSILHTAQNGGVQGALKYTGGIEQSPVYPNSPATGTVQMENGVGKIEFRTGWYNNSNLLYADWTINITVESSDVAVTEVTLDQTEVTLEVGGTVTLTATVSPEDATDKTVTWTSDNAAVATVADGVVTAVAAGTATITATAGGKSATCTVTVEEAEPEYVLDVSSYDAPLMPYAAVSTITFSGAEVVGTPVVTVEKVSDYVKTAVIDVVLAEGTANNAEIGLSILHTAQNGGVQGALKYTGGIEQSPVYPNSPATGTVQMENGVGKIEFRTGWYNNSNLLYADWTINITVESSDVAVTEVTLDQTEVTLEVGGTVTLTATVSPEDATDKTVTWTSDNTAVATVADGVVTAVAAGTATITATAGEQTATCTVTVAQATAEATVSFTAQAGGEFLLAPQLALTVSSDTAERYGYNDQTDQATQVSTIDVLVAAHAVKFGDSFNKETAKTYLLADGNFITTMFGSGNGGNVCILVNGMQPILRPGTGAGIEQAAVVDGDFVELFVYQNPAYTDKYVWLTLPDGTKADGQSTYGGTAVTVAVRGFAPFSYGYDGDAGETLISGAGIYLVDIATGALTSLGVTTGADGTASVTIPADYVGKTVYLTAKGTEMAMTLSKVTVTEPPASTACELTALEVAVGGNAIDAATVQPLTPAFEGTTTEYSTPILDYESDKNNRFVWVNVTAPEGTTVTAKCGSSNVTTLTSGEWGVVQLQGGYFWSPTYSGPLTPGEYNQVTITVSKEGEDDKVYTVTIPMQPDIANRSLVWKNDLTDAIYFAKNDENAALTVEAQYKNRPLENTDVITYQWYSNTTASTEGGTAIEGATAATYKPNVAELGTGYYYAVASCNDLDSITSSVIAVTITDEAAPTSVTIVCDYPYTIPNSWEKALGGVSYVAKAGDTLQLKAVDENGKETPVVWLNTSINGGTLDKTTGVYTISNTAYSYVQVASLYDANIKSEEKVIQVADYSINQYNKTPSVTLATDGQSFNKVSTQGGVENYTIWSCTPSAENIAELVTDLTKKAARIEFTAMRPGTIAVSLDLDLNGDGIPDGNGQTDSATLTINGIAVEDASGALKKTYLEISTEAPNPTMQLKALSSTENAAFTWSSADETIATVDENGLVTARGVGSVIISANDGTYTGGIKVVVTSAETPYFEQIDFSTTTAWANGLLNTTWKTATFKSATLEYTGLKMTKAAADTLTLTGTTLYDTDKYTAVAAYTDVNGEAQSVAVNSGAKTELKGIPFGTSIITITLADKTDETKKTVYSFEITRPRDTVKTIASNGLTFVPDGREIWKDQYGGKTEGIMYVANEDGSFAQYQGVNSSRLYYRTYAMNGLDAFALTVKSTSAFAHIRLSTDGGETWTYLGQSGASGLSTGKITIPKSENGENAVVKVMIQILDDVTYAQNVAAGKDGFADSTPNVYSLWVEQIPELSAECDIVTAVTDSGDWYPTFAKDRTSYRLVVAPGAAAPVLTFTVSDGAKVTVGETQQTPDDAGKYNLTLTTSSVKIVVAASDGMSQKTYSFGYSEREANSAADKVTDYLLVNGQYVNGSAYGTNPQQVLTGGLLSLGNFGGYVTLYLENGLTDDPKNAYGVDFYINGNAFEDTSTGTGLGSMEPGQVWVSEDGNTWYALAGSEHYEPTTLWDYSVTYTKTETGGTAWSDNYGNTNTSTHGRTFAWPNPGVYTMNDLPTRDSFTLTGILLPCVDGTITGTDSFNSFSTGAQFGYVDTFVNGTANPYLDNSDYTNASTGFDLAWAVDSAGNPVDVSGKSFHYVKVVTASNLMAGAANEKSTEVASLVRAAAQSSAVGVTAAPSGVTFTSGEKTYAFSFETGKQIYEVAIPDTMLESAIQINGAAESDNIYINNQRISADGKSSAFTFSTDSQKLIRIIVQNGEKEPAIYLLKVKAEEEVAVTGITLDKTELTMTQGGEPVTLTATVTPDNAADKTVVWTSDNTAVATVADGVVTAVAAGTATITATAGEQTATCTVTVEAAGEEYSIDLETGDADAGGSQRVRVTNINLSGVEVYKTQKTGDYAATVLLPATVSKDAAITYTLDCIGNPMIAQNGTTYGKIFVNNAEAGTMTVDETDATKGTWTYTAVPAWDENGEATITFKSQWNTISWVTKTYTLNLRILGEENQAPTLSSGIEAENTAYVALGKSYELRLTDDGIFTDAELDDMTYTVSVNGAEPVEANAVWHQYTPSVEGETTLVFRAVDANGNTSADSYTVTVKAVEVQEIETGDGSGDRWNPTISKIAITKPQNVILPTDGSCLAYALMDADTKTDEPLLFMLTLPSTSGMYNNMVDFSGTKVTGTYKDLWIGTYTPQWDGSGEAEVKISVCTRANSTSGASYTLKLKIADPDNKAPTFAGDSSGTDTVKQYFDYTVDVASLFTDADDTVTLYQVSVNGGEWTDCDASYVFNSQTTGENTLKFRAYDLAEAMSGEYTLTLTVTDYAPDENATPINDSFTDGKVLSVTIQDSEGSPIEGVKVTVGEMTTETESYDDSEWTIQKRVIDVTLPGTVGTSDTVQAYFHLVQNEEGWPVFTATSNLSGTTDMRWDNNKTDTLSIKLSGGLATDYGYLYEKEPSWPVNEHTAYEINYHIWRENNQAPVLKDGVTASTVKTMDQYSSYTINPKNFFTDPEGDKLTYYISEDGGEFEEIVPTGTGSVSRSYEFNEPGTKQISLKAKDALGDESVVYTENITIEELIRYEIATGDKGTASWGGTITTIYIQDQEVEAHSYVKTDDTHRVVAVQLKDTVADDALVEIDWVYKSFEASTVTMKPSTNPVQLVDGKATVELESGGNTFFRTHYYYTILLSNKPNNLPTLAEGVKTTASAEIMVGETYELDLSSIFTDADGDPMTYTVSVNGAEATTAEAAYSLTAAESATSTLEFRAADYWGTSEETYTVTLTAGNSEITRDVTFKVPDGVTPTFYATVSFDDEKHDVIGEELTSVKGESENGWTSYTVAVPENITQVSFRGTDADSNEWGGMSVAITEDMEPVILRQLQAVITTKLDVGGTLTTPTCEQAVFKIKTNDANYAVSGSSFTDDYGYLGYRFLLIAGDNSLIYTYYAVPLGDAANAYAENVGNTKTITSDSADVAITSLPFGTRSSYTITAPTDATVEMFRQTGYYVVEAVPAFDTVDNGDGTTTRTYNNVGMGYTFRASKEGEITKAGYIPDDVSEGEGITIDWDGDDRGPKYRGAYDTSSNDGMRADDSMYVNINYRNELMLAVDEEYQLRSYRIWEIINSDTRNTMIEPDFHYEIISGRDVISITSTEGLTGNAKSNWLDIKGLKAGTAVIEVTYDALDIVSGASETAAHINPIQPITYNACDPDRTALIVVQVGAQATDVVFGIKNNGGKAWDAEHDTLYFMGNSAGLELTPSVTSGSIAKVEVSGNKGASWTQLTAADGTYTATIVPGNNIIRITKGDGTVSHQLVRGDKLSITITEVDGASDKDGIVEAGEQIKLVFHSMHFTISKMSGVYNPQKFETRFTLNGDTISDTAGGYYYPTGVDPVITIPGDAEVGDAITLTNGYTAMTSSFGSGAGAHRSIKGEVPPNLDADTVSGANNIFADITLAVGMRTDGTSALVEKIELNQTEATIETGKTITLTATVTPADAINKKLTWSSDNTAVAMVSETGVVTANGEGTAAITATAGGKTAQCKVTVVAAEPDEPELDFGLAENEIVGYVTVSFVDNGIRLESELSKIEEQFRTPLGTIVQPTEVPFKAYDTIAAVTLRLLDAMDITAVHGGNENSSFYLSKIGNFTVGETTYASFGEFDAGTGSGWMITQNDWFINKGASEFPVKDGDVIEWQYTCQLGADIGDTRSQEEVDEVEALIDAIGNVTLDSEAAITAAREAYDELAPVQQAAVSNYETLTAAEAELARLKASEEDKAAANAVINLIEAIGDEITEESKDEIEAARKAYDALTDTQKDLVTNYDELEEAEDYLELLNRVDADIANIYKTTGDYLAGKTIGTGSINGEWAALGLARSGRTVADSYYEAAAAYVKENIRNGQLHTYKSTENSRLILALTAIGKDVTDVEGHNLLSGLNDLEYIGKQGVNGLIYALIALDSHDYTPVDITRDDLVAAIVDKQLDDGGWSLTTSSEVDLTAMAIQALAPYYSDANVKAAVDKALTWLSNAQNQDGSFSTTDGSNAESIAQVIVALTAMGIDPDEDSRFIKTGITPVQALAQFYVEGGGFEHIEGTGLDDMATEQAYYALAAYARFKNGQTSLYDMSDVTIETSAANQEAANAVIALINAIGTVDLDKEDEIEAARSAYDALTDAQKDLVTNYETLTDAETKLAQLKQTAADTAAADAVKTLIDAIGTVDSTDKADEIEAARRAYNALTTLQKNLVGAAYLNKLEAAEAALAALEKAEADEAAAQRVENLISAIGSSITLGSESKINTARNAYDALTADQKALVSNYQTLLNAEAALDTLKSTVSVTFSLLGCYKHGTNETTVHTLAKGNLQTWIAAKTYKVKPGATVKDLFEQALTAAGMTWSNPSGNYIESITKNGVKIGEFTNGKNSGWMYTLNGKHPGLGVKQQTLVNGDKVVFHYTDDYTKEEGSTSSSSSGTTTGSSTTTGYTNYITTTTTTINTETAESVDRLIEDIGEEITLDSEAKILAARAAYDKLTETQKKLVEKYDILVAAEAKLAQLKGVSAENVYIETGDYIQGLGTPGVGAIGGEWMVIGLARSGRPVPTGYYDHVLNYVRENINDAQQLHSAKSSDNSRLILALTSIDKDVTNVDGHDLLKGLNDMDYIQKQGINGPIWALMAFDSGNYPVPEGNVSRDKLIEVILDAQLDDGGWALSGERSDPDMTGMAIQALAPYMESNTAVNKAVEEAIWALSELQNDNGSYTSVDGPNSESISQVIVALAALGIDADTDARFVKNGISALDALLTYYVPGGGFRHVLEGNLDGMATEQAYYALVAYNRMLQAQNFLYDMTDVIDAGGDVIVEETTEPTEAPTEPIAEEEADNGNAVVIWTGVMAVCAAAIAVLLLNRKKLFGKFL